MSTDTAAEPACESRRAGPVVGFLRWLENLSDMQYTYLLLAPIFVLPGIVAVYSLLRTFGLLLYVVPTDLSSVRFAGLDNYVTLFTGEKNRFLPGGTTFLSTRFDAASLLDSTLAITLILAAASVLFETLTGLEQVLVLGQNFYGRRQVHAAIITPWAVPIVIQGMMFFLTFDSSVGSATPMLAGPGAVASTNTLNDTASATFIIIVADIWKISAFMALLILAGLQGISRSLYDAACVAGASKWQQFRYITLPLILPAIRVAVLFRSVQAMRVYGIVGTVSSCIVVPSLLRMVVSTLNTHEGMSAVIVFVTAAIIGVVVMGIISRQGENAI